MAHWYVLRGAWLLFEKGISAVLSEWMAVEWISRCVNGLLPLDSCSFSRSLDSSSLMSGGSRWASCSASRMSAEGSARTTSSPSSCLPTNSTRPLRSSSLNRFGSWPSWREAIAVTCSTRSGLTTNRGRRTEPFSAVTYVHPLTSECQTSTSYGRSLLRLACLSTSTGLLPSSRIAATPTMIPFTIRITESPAPPASHSPPQLRTCHRDRKSSPRMSTTASTRLRVGRPWQT